MSIGFFLCKLPRWAGGGHRRSREHRNGEGGGWVTSDGGRVASKEQPTDAVAKCFYCPRCGRETRYKVKPKVA